MITASCHCGRVTLEADVAPEEVTDCNCSICRRYGALWAYYRPSQIRVDGKTDTYMWGEKSIAFHHCAKCGCITHFTAVDPTDPHDRMAVNANLMPSEVRVTVRVRHFDGAVTWKYID